MKNTTKRHLKAIAFVCTGIIWAGYFLLTATGEKNIRHIMDSALQESIVIDYHRRGKKEIKYNGNPLSRKVKGTVIASANGKEYVEFEDSVEEYVAERLTTQYILIQVSPVQPNDFNDIFRDELKKKGLDCPTGIIYRHSEKAIYSQPDSAAHQDIILSNVMTIDAKGAASVQAWMNCDTMTTLSHSDYKIFWLIALAAALFILILYYKTKKASKAPSIQQPQEAPVVEDSGKIRIDSVEQKIYINGQEYHVQTMTFQLFALLARTEPAGTPQRNHTGTILTVLT